MTIYTDFDSGTFIDNLYPGSPLWVGAWWLGFVISAGASWLCALIIGKIAQIITYLIFQLNCGPLLGCYPAVISTNPRLQTTKNGVVEFNNDKVSPGYGTLKDLPKVIWALLINPCYMMINFGGGADGMVLSGLSAFLPKFLQSQYGLSAGFASALVGIMVVPAGG